MAVHIRLGIDRIHMSVSVTSKDLYGFVIAQLHGMKDLQSELLPNGKITVRIEKYLTRMSYYPNKKRKIAEIEIGTTKSKHKYFRLSLFPSQFGSGEFENFKEVLALMLPEFNYQKLYSTAKVSYIELAADSASQAQHSFIHFRAKCNSSEIIPESDGTKGSTYVGSKLVKWIKVQMGRIRNMASAPNKDPKWRASKIGGIKVHCKNDLRNSDRRLLQGLY